MKTYEAVLFDFDGTLVDTEWAIYQEVLAIFQAEGEHLPLETYCQCIGAGYEVWSPQDYLEELTGKTYDWESIRKVRDQKIRARLETQGLIEGALESLNITKERGLRLAVVSSSSHSWVDAWLEKLEITSYFEHVTCKEDAARLKPAPDLFLKGAERMELTPEKCLVVEDSRNGMLAALEAGMDVIAVPNRVTEVLDFSEALVRLKSLTEYPAQLSKLLQ